MIRSSTRQRGLATEELGIVAVIVLVLGLVAIYGFQSKRERSIDCVRRLAAAADGRLPEGARCPVGGDPFAVRKTGRHEVLACPDPKRHLGRPPRYERDEGNLWRLEQEPPAPPAGPADLRRATHVLAVRSEEARTLVEREPKFWWRWIVGPLVQLPALVYLVALLVQIKAKERGPWGVTAVVLVAVILFGCLAWACVDTVEGGESIRIDPVEARVTRQRWIFGVEREPELYEGCEGMALVQVVPKQWSLLLFHRGPEGRAVTQLLEGIPEDELAWASWLAARWRP